MSINELPEEILVRILSLLSRSDRLESALTCRRWAQTVARAPPLLRDIRLVIEGKGMKEAETVFANSYRQYEDLQLINVSSLNFDAAFWTNVGPTLRKLELNGRLCSLEVFYAILQSCPNLESLEIRDSYDCFPPPQLPPGMDLERIQKSMRNLRHLHLDIRINEDILEHLFILMPNVSTIDLLEFDLESDLLSRLTNMLGANKRVTMLDLTRPGLGDNCEQALRLFSASLRKLRCGQEIINEEVFDSFLNCTMLRDLEIEVGRHFHPSLLNEIIRNVPELESLMMAIQCYEQATLEDLMPLFNLRKLRILYMDLDLETDSGGRISEKFLRELARLPSLETFTVEASAGFADSTRLRILAGLPTLQNLTISRSDWDAETLGILVSEFQKLTTLDIYGTYGPGTRLRRDQHSELEQNPPKRTRSDCQGQLESSSLEVLKLGDLPLIDAGLGCITALHSRLRVVCISGDCDMTKAELVILCQRAPLLEKLDVSSPTIDDTVLEALGKLCGRLRSLGWLSRDKISSEAWREFESRRPRVKCSWYRTES